MPEMVVLVCQNTKPAQFWYRNRPNVPCAAAESRIAKLSLKIAMLRHGVACRELSCRRRTRCASPLPRLHCAQTVQALSRCITGHLFCPDLRGWAILHAHNTVFPTGSAAERLMTMYNGLPQIVCPACELYATTDSQCTACHNKKKLPLVGGCRCSKLTHTLTCTP